MLLAGLRRGIEKLAPRPASSTADDCATRVFITTTLLSGQPDHVADDYGTVINDEDYHGLFTFTASDLNSNDIGPALALAARCSASYPAAFEPGFIPIGGSAGTTHPDMQRYIALTGNAYAADGGLLANRPLKPALGAIFDRPAPTDQDVRRVLAYIVPATSTPVHLEPATLARPPDLLEGLLEDIEAVKAQTIVNELLAIQDHNSQTSAAADLRSTLVDLAGENRQLLTDDLYRAFRDQAIHDIIHPVVTEVLRQATVTPLPLREETDHQPDTLTYGHDLPGLYETAAQYLRKRCCLPPNLSDVNNHVLGAFGRSAYDAAQAIVLSLVRGARARASTTEERAALDGLRHQVGTVLSHRNTSAVQPHDVVTLPDTPNRPSHDDLKQATLNALNQWCQTRHRPEELTQAWAKLTKLVADPALTLLTEPLDPDSPHKPQSDNSQAARIASTLYHYLQRPGRSLALFDLAAATCALTPVRPNVEQHLELIQISADSRTNLDHKRSLAAEKLTGLQLHHFGAFYKSSWRANDWMWGRIDGIGWLVHILLDPRRLRARWQNQTASGCPPALLDELCRIRTGGDTTPQAASEEPAVPDEVRDELCSVFVTADPPRSLPETSRWVAEGLQRIAAAEELGWVAEQIECDVHEGTFYPEEAQAFVKEYKAAVRHPHGQGIRRSRSSSATGDGCSPSTVPDGKVAELFEKCHVSAETLGDEERSPMYNRLVAQTLAVTADAADAVPEAPATVKPVLALAKSGTALAYRVVQALNSSSPKIAFAGVIGLILGAVLATSTISWIQAAGGVCIAASIVLLVLASGRRIKMLTSTVAFLAAIAIVFAGFIPHVQDWVTEGVVWVSRQVTSRPWIWAAIVAFVLLPPFFSAANAITRHNERRQHQKQITRTMPRPPE